MLDKTKSVGREARQGEDTQLNYDDARFQQWDHSNALKVVEN